ncbi:MAG: penicillin-insensitive murein endopeptidase [Hyphomicrobiaceae bacterium]
MRRLSLFIFIGLFGFSGIVSSAFVGHSAMAEAKKSSEGDNTARSTGTAGAKKTTAPATKAKPDDPIKAKLEELEAEAKKPKSKPKPLPAAKSLFGKKRQAAALAPQAIGYYSRGCLAGAKQLPETGPAWQAMRLSRNRNWGHPVLIDLIMRLATEAKEAGEFPGLLVGDIAQPRGGPMLTGHASHQVGLDADVWLRTPPKKLMSRKKRETFQPISMMAKNWLDVNPKAFTDFQVALIRRAASYSEVARIGVNPAIKVALCRAVGGDKDKPWLRKIQGWKGHHYHMHIRIKCPPGSKGCRDQKAPTGTSCAAAEKWYANTKAWLERPKSEKKKAKKKVPKKKRKPKPPITMAGLPKQCQYVLEAANDKLELLPTNPLKELRKTKLN